MAKSLMEELKDLFKTDEQKRAERQQQLDDAKNREKDVTEQLGELAREYDSAHPKEEPSFDDLDSLFPDDNDYTKRDTGRMSSDAIKKQAYEEQKADKEKEIKSAEDKYGAKFDALAEEQDKLKEDYDEGIRELEAAFHAGRENAKDNAMKRGITRGSILEGALNSLDSDEREGKRELEKSYMKDSRAIEEEIARLEEEKQKALDDIDLKYADKLQQRIDKLTAENEKQVKEAEKYNEELDVKRAQAERERQQKVQEYLDNEAAKAWEEKERTEAYERVHGYTGDKRENYEKRYRIAYDFYMSLSEDIALDALRASSSMRYYLGDYYYNMLVKELADRV